MLTQHRGKWMAGMALGFFVTVMLVEFLQGTGSGVAINWTERAIVWALAAVPFGVLWVLAMDWFLRKFVARQPAANGSR